MENGVPVFHDQEFHNNVWCSSRSGWSDSRGFLWKAVNVREYDSIEFWNWKVQFFRNVRIIFSEVSEVSLFSFVVMPWNSKLNSIERSPYMIAALRFSVACGWSSVSRLANLLSSFSMFSWATSKLVSTAVIRGIRLDSICAWPRSTDWNNWNASFNVGSTCGFCAFGFLECPKAGPDLTDARP